MSDVKDTKQKNWVYSQTVKEHFFNPKNILKIPVEEYNADWVWMVGSPSCGDMMKMWIKVKDNKIIDCKWQTFGCASAISATSVLSEMVMENGGMTLDDAMQLRAKDIVLRLGGLPDTKIHCSVLWDQALRKAVNNYFKKSWQLDRVIDDSAKIVCWCMNVTDHDIEDCVLDNKFTLEEVQKATKVWTGCGQCIPKVEKLIEDIKEKYFN